MRRRVFCLVVLLALKIPFGSVTLHAQQMVTSVVVDSTGGVLPNAHVELKNAAGEVIASAEADATGTVKLERVPPGRYDLIATFEGFEPTTVRVTVGNRSPAPVRITLPLARVTQEVTVGTSPVEVDTASAQNLNGVTVDQSTLGDLPVFDQNVLAMMSRFLDSASIATGGVTLVVNGMEANGLGVSASAIQQIKINQDPYSAEYSRPGRGRIEVITKPGSSAYHGTANVIFRDSVLNAKDVFAVTKPAEQRRIFEGYLSGPVRGGQNSSFVLSLNRDEDDQQAIVYAVGPSGPIQTNAPAPLRNLLVSGSVSHQAGEKNSLMFRVSYQDRTIKNQGVGGVVLAESGANNQFKEEEALYSQQTIISPRLLHQTRFLYGQYYQPTSSVSASPRIVVVDAFTGGGAQADRLQTEHHFTLTDMLTWSPAHHVVKVGINVPDWSRRRFDDGTNVGGTWYFSNLAQYNAGKPFAFIQQQGNGHEVFLEKVLGAFVQDEIQVTERLSASLGLRYDWQNYFGDNNNVAPRASLAFAPGAQRTVLRGGAGLFYDRTGPGPISDLLHSQHSRLLRYMLTDPGFPDPLLPGQSLSAQPASIVHLAPDISIPATLQYSVGIERQIRKKTAVSATYVGMRGFDLFRSRDVNAPLPPNFVARPDPNYGVIRRIESRGRMTSQSLQFTVRGDITRFFTGQTQYTVSKTLNDTNGINWYPSNDYDSAGEWGRADSDQRHRLDAIGAFNVRDLFKVGVALSLYSGRPYSLLAGQDLFNNGRSNTRPIGVSRNTLEGPRYADLDMRWSRDIRIRKNRKGPDAPAVTIGVDAFNVLDTTNFVGYIGTIGSPFFGQAVAAQPLRRLQLSMRAQF